MRLSLVTDHGQYASSCGYCGTRETHEDSSWSHGMMAEVLTPEAYQALIDRGWRRSGHWMYQPRNESTCCQLITIRLNVNTFNASKEQRRAARIWEEYLAGAPLKQSHHHHHQQQEQQQQAVEEQGHRPAQQQHEQPPPTQQQHEQAQPSTHHQQQPPQQQEQQQRQLQQLNQNPDGMEFPVVGGGRWELGSEPRGASPKRPHEDLEDEGVWGADATGALAGIGAGSAAGAAPPDSKRQRSGAEDGGVGSSLVSSGLWEDDDEMEGESPRTQLASQMQQVLSAHREAGGLAAFLAAAEIGAAPAAAEIGAAPAAAEIGAAPSGPAVQAPQQPPSPQPQQEPPQGRERTVPLDGLLAASLAAALERCLAEEWLPGPAGAYPPPRVQAPSAKQRRVLAANVVLTSPFPLAVTAAARRALDGAGASCSKGASEAAGCGTSQSPPLPQEQQQRRRRRQQGAVPSAEAVAELLIERAELPGGMVATADRGHLNFHAGSGSSAAEPGSPEQGGGSAGQCPVQEGSMPAAAVVADEHSSAAGAAAAAAAGAAAAAAAGAGHSRGVEQQDMDGEGTAAAAGAGGVPWGVSRHFELTMVRSDASLVHLEFMLYKKYQVVHHGDAPAEVTPRSFQRFLCDTPIRHAPQAEYPPNGCPPCGFGSFHQQYWIDGRLVAVGVVDILPSCLSSVYLFWDPDLASLSLGRVSALKEIDWVRDQGTACPSLHYYYLGFYIHNNHRMRYKGDYGPSDLLCPKNKCWVPMERCRQALEQPGMVALSELPGAVLGLGQEHLVGPDGRPMAPPAEPCAEEVDGVRVFLQGPAGKGQMVTLSGLCRAGVLSASAQRQLRRRVGQWVRAVGPVWPSILYHLS